MACDMLSKGEASIRHDEVETVLYRSALLMGFQAVRQPTGLDLLSSDLRPDLMVIMPGRRILVDVAICHPLAPGRVKRAISLKALGTAKVIEGAKRRKYLKMKTRHPMEIVPFVVETCGGVGAAAVKLLKAMARAAEEHLGMWPRQDIIQHVVGSVAISVQKGSAMAYLEGYDRTLCTLRKSQTEEEQYDEGDEDAETKSDEEKECDDLGQGEEEDEGEL